jgi:hypothetical protein
MTSSFCYQLIFVYGFLILLSNQVRSFELKRQKFVTQQSIYSNVNKVTNIQTKVNAAEYMKYLFNCKRFLFILEFHNRNKQSISLMISLLAKIFLAGMLTV